MDVQTGKLDDGTVLLADSVQLTFRTPDGRVHVSLMVTTPGELDSLVSGPLGRFLR